MEIWNNRYWFSKILYFNFVSAMIGVVGNKLFATHNFYKINNNTIVSNFTHTMFLFYMVLNNKWHNNCKPPYAKFRLCSLVKFFPKNAWNVIYYGYLFDAMWGGKQVVYNNADT